MRVPCSIPLDYKVSFWSWDSRNVILELDNAVGFISVGDQVSPSYVTSLDRSKGDYFLGPHASSAAHVFAVKKEEDVFRLLKIALNGESEELFSTEMRIVSIVPTSSDESFFMQLMSSVDHNIYYYS